MHLLRSRQNHTYPGSGNLRYFRYTFNTFNILIFSNLRFYIEDVENIIFNWIYRKYRKYIKNIVNSQILHNTRQNTGTRRKLRTQKICSHENIQKCNLTLAVSPPCEMYMSHALSYTGTCKKSIERQMFWLTMWMVQTPWFYFCIASCCWLQLFNSLSLHERHCCSLDFFLNSILTGRIFLECSLYFSRMHLHTLFIVAKF